MADAMPETVKLFQVYEQDLAELERLLPLLADELGPALTNRTRVHFRRCQAILSSVRWGYGPMRDVRRIDPTGDTDESAGAG